MREEKRRGKMSEEREWREERRLKRTERREN